MDNNLFKHLSNSTFGQKSTTGFISIHLCEYDKRPAISFEFKQGHDTSGNFYIATIAELITNTVRLSSANLPPVDLKDKSNFFTPFESEIKKALPPEFQRVPGTLGLLFIGSLEMFLIHTVQDADNSVIDQWTSKKFEELVDSKVATYLHNTANKTALLVGRCGDNLKLWVRNNVTNQVECSNYNFKDMLNERREGYDQRQHYLFGYSYAINQSNIIHSEIGDTFVYVSDTDKLYLIDSNVEKLIKSRIVYDLPESYGFNPILDFKDIRFEEIEGTSEGYRLSLVHGTSTYLATHELNNKEEAMTFFNKLNADIPPFTKELLSHYETEKPKKYFKLIYCDNIGGLLTFLERRGSKITHHAYYIPKDKVKTALNRFTKIYGKTNLHKLIF